MAEADQLLSAIAESSDDAILSKDLNGIITSWNKGAERLFGYTPEEVIGKPVNILIPADRQDEEPTILDRIRRGIRIDHYETGSSPKRRKAVGYFTDHFSRPRCAWPNQIATSLCRRGK
jgi:PAS domain S-box-containing protein